ncbi:uncharacterized protein LOC102379959 [Alligator sinensis]|uniref:Uncharacterized protein LOC102379959 n=1 Tax=Alligator sinensis TaxID=38654 RepID=A0A1U8DRR8_ALLSI|nr:uncharacterized protein LOC102379959 [Alligator sinensis]
MRAPRCPWLGRGREWYPCSSAGCFLRAKQDPLGLIPGSRPLPRTLLPFFGGTAAFLQAKQGAGGSEGGWETRECQAGNYPHPLLQLSMSLPHLKLEVPHTRRDLPRPWVASRTGEPCMGHSPPSAKQPRALDPEGAKARARLQQELEAMAEQVGQLRENLAQISWGLAWAGLASGIPPRLERGVPPGLAQLLKEELGAVVDAVLRGVVPPPRCRPPGDQAEALALVVRKPPVAPLLPHSGLDGPPCQPPAQGSLTPQHLKKAKLMFFYTRYPSATTLKAYFPDVRFSRSVTAQLIKWFSNFREFFYLQAERFSRQALSGGRAGPQGPSVTPACQLARVLGQHFNKSSDYQVPTSFLEVTQVAVREFSQAIAGGRDADPAWKKPIYRVISKLEANIPEAFRAPPGPPHT